MLQRADALTDDFVPGDVGERHSELNQLADALRPVLDGDPAEHVLIYGPSGAGKTAVARYCLKQIENQHLGVHTVHIDCWQHHTRRKAIEQLCMGCAKGAILHQQLAHDELLDRVRSIEEPYLVVLDEVDQLDDMTLLRELFGMDGVAVIGIANRERELMSRVDDWLNTRLKTCLTSQFDTYSDNDLVSILQRRADFALTDGVVTEDQLRTIARRSEGNAGIAIGALRLAARRAQNRPVDRITDDTVDASVPDAERKEKQKSFSRLTYEQRLLFSQLPSDGSWVRGERLHAAYSDVSEDPRGKRSRRNWLQKMQHYNLVEQKGGGRGTKYRRQLTDVEYEL